MTLDSVGRFLKIYANLPVNLREEIIAIVDDKPITWNSAYREIRDGVPTELGQKILKKLIELDIL